MLSTCFGIVVDDRFDATSMIQSGQIRLGERLPAERELARQFKRAGWAYERAGPDLSALTRVSGISKRMVTGDLVSVNGKPVKRNLSFADESSPFPPR